MKKKLSNKKFHIITLSVMGLCLGLGIAGTIVSNYFANSLDNYLGRGEIIYDEGREGITYDDSDTEFYDQPFEKSTQGKTDSSHAAYKIGEKINDEGEVLLKNDGTLPLAKNTAVTPFGYRYVDPIMTGTGSGAATLLQDFVVDASTGLSHYFNVNTKMESVLKNASPIYATSTGYKSKADENGTFSGATSSVGEFNSSQIYQTSEIGNYKTGIVFIGRQGGEGNDLQKTAYFEGGKKIADHQLQLMPYEKDMLAFAKTNCDKVIVILNSPNPIELGDLKNDDGINAMIWVGTTGSRGFESLGKILCGDVNPSGALVDTYYSDFTNDPTYNNFGDYRYANSPDNCFLEYEEGIYLGYKYYETKYGENESEYLNQVVYPFGYGLHYGDDQVSQTFDSLDYDSQTGKISVTGTIKNDSNYDTKEIVQIYNDAPYYENGRKIEKSKKNLVAVEKIAVAKNSSSSFEITINDEDLASYDYNGYYTNGKGSYVLEKGNYNLYLGDNSHVSFGIKSFNVSKNIVYSKGGSVEDSIYLDKRSSDQTAANNLYQNVSDYLDGKGDFGNSVPCDNLSRSNNLSSSTTSPIGKNASAAVLNQINASNQGTIDYSEKILAKYGTVAPTEEADNGLILSQLRGLDFDDKKWDLLLDQLQYTGSGLKEINKLLGNGSFNTGKITALGKPTTSESDGPQAIGKTGVSDGTGAANAYPAEVVVASTWNKELAQEMGKAIGDEALSQGSNGWYAPACNIHRSPFLGRVYEYYSEDGYLSGLMSQHVIQGAASKGYTAYMKHFALNDQELNRGSVLTWCNEQAMREIYFKPFEMAVKYATVSEKYLAPETEGSNHYVQKTRTMKATTGVMTSMNRIGGLWTALDYNLCTSLLRNEWGFQGSVITDSVTPINNQMNVAIAGGNDFFLTFIFSQLQDSTSVAAKWSIRQAIHNISYAVVNSNAMQNVGPGKSYNYAMSPWVWIVIGFDSLMGIIIVGLGVWNILLLVNSKKKKEDIPQE